MAEATYLVPNFHGGEISDAAQGRADRPDYKTSLNICSNAFPLEIGPWTRRPGSRFAGTTRAGAAGRTIEFDFEDASPITLEFTDGKLRFRSGTTLITTNDDQVVVGVSAANPAVVEVTSAVTWASGDTVVFSGQSTPLLEARQFVMTSIDGTHFSLSDPLTGLSIDGSTLGALVAGATVAHVHELPTPFTGGSWATLRAVQAETTMVLLNVGQAPQALTVTTEPSTSVNPQFSIVPVTFQDGPYLDPFTNGVQAVPSAESGIINLSLQFPAYDSAAAYSKGSFVTLSSVNYRSLIDQNVGNQPDTHPTDWETTSASAAINDGRGFLGTDIGRLVRLLSEPPRWDKTHTYGSDGLVSYNPSGVPGATTYYQSLISSNLGIPPGSDLSSWGLIPQGAAIWTWGKIIGPSNIIDRTLGASVGDMVNEGGINAAFDGNFANIASDAAALTIAGGFLLPGAQVTIDSYVGKSFSGGTPQQIAQVTVYPSSDSGFGNGQYQMGGSAHFFILNIELGLRASHTAPHHAADGTLLGLSGFINNQLNAVTIISNDQTTAWEYVWVEIVIISNVGQSTGTTAYNMASFIGQVSFFNPPSSSTSSAGCQVEILGPSLLQTTPIITWRLGVYSDTTGWPTCGCYDDGRLWLGGAVSNRFDASTSNGIVPGSSVINFAPTDQFGVVGAANGISETINADSTNPLFWMIPDLQGILIGTQGGEFLLLAPTAGSIAPNNITSRRTTKIGSANIEPRRTDHTIAFVKRYQRKLMEYFADVFSGKFSAPNLADKAEHIVRTGIAELAYTDAMTPILWGRNTDGSLFGVTYKRDALTTSQGPTYAAWHRHTLGSGRTVESITSGPSVDGNLDSLTMVTTDAATNIRHVEILTDVPDEDTALADCWFLDDAVNPTSISSSTTPNPPTAPFGGLTINGLWHLNGKTVQVFAGGLDCGFRGDNKTTFTDFVVSDGSVFVPYGDNVSAGCGGGLFTADFVASLPLSQIVIGFTYNSDGQIVRRIDMAETGARNGPALGKLRRTHRFAMLLSNTLGISVGTSFDHLVPTMFGEADEMTALPALTTYSGVYQDSLDDDYSYDSMLCWRISRPFPATICAVSGNLQTQDQ